jgi:hypothetical protein
MNGVYRPTRQPPFLGRKEVVESYVWVRLVSDDWEYTERIQ